MTSLNPDSLTISDNVLTAESGGNIITSSMLEKFATSSSGATYSDSVIRPIGSIIIGVTTSRTSNASFSIRPASGSWRCAAVGGLANVYVYNFNDSPNFSVPQCGIAIAYRVS